MTDAPAYLPLPEKHGEPARVGRRLAPFHSNRLPSPLRTSPYVGKRKRSRCKENEAFYASRLFFPDGNSAKQPAARQGSSLGLASGHRFVPAFPIIRNASLMNLRGQKQGVQKRAYTARLNRRLRAEQRKRKKIREEADRSSRVILYRSVTAASRFTRVSILAGPRYGFYIFSCCAPALRAFRPTPAPVPSAAKTRALPADRRRPHPLSGFHKMCWGK